MVASGMNSRIAGDLPFVRFPRRIVAICVNEPTGFASPRRASMMPAMVVVATAPSPIIKIPSFPRGVGIATGCLMRRLLAQFAAHDCRDPSARLALSKNRVS